MTHWANQYIGRPWENGAQGPDAFDCWGLARFIQREHFARDLPAVDVDAMDILAVAREIKGNGERTKWSLVDTQADGDAVLLAHARYPSHVGVWIDVDGGGLLHCVKGPGVIFSTLSALRLAGWGHIEFYRYQG